MSRKCQGCFPDRIAPDCVDRHAKAKSMSRRRPKEEVGVPC